MYKSKQTLDIDTDHKRISRFILFTQIPIAQKKYLFTNALLL